jgi:LmbE family N-acetylglucosaminyl deacetylase
MPKPIVLKTMAKRRARELQVAAKILGIHTVKLLTIPDGKVASNINKLTRAVKATAKKFKPDCIVSFGPCGITGHRDHIATGIAARRVARACGVSFAAMVLSLTLQHGARKFLIARRRSPHYTRRFTFLNPTTSFVTNPVVKRQAIRCHASQMDGPGAFTGFPAYVVKGLLHREYFNIWKK